MDEQTDIVSELCKISFRHTHHATTFVDTHSINWNNLLMFLTYKKSKFDEDRIRLC